jgi:CDP-diacylglycerol pyrophosphatase
LRLLSFRYIHAILLYLLLAAALSISESACATESRDALLTIVSSCLDIRAPDYCQHCPVPRLESPCAQNRDCKATTDVWEETPDYVVIRDRKMCGCPSGFVHGLIIPRAQITGIEDPKRPANIWGKAWTIARKRIAKEDTIALVINPPGSRTQDQLHIHIVRLRSDAREHFNDARSRRLWNLNEVWNSAAEVATAAKLKNYGVLVTLHRGGGFLILVDEGSLEKLYTQWKCK